MDIRNKNEKNPNSIALTRSKINSKQGVRIEVKLFLKKLIQTCL